MRVFILCVNNYCRYEFDIIVIIIIITTTHSLKTSVQGQNDHSPRENLKRGFIVHTSFYSFFFF